MSAAKPPLALFHTAEANRSLFAALLAETAPEVDAVHAVGADLLARAMDAGELTPAVRRDAARRIADFAAETDAAATLCTCSTLGPAAEDAGALRVDRPMAERALAAAWAGTGRVACLASAMAPTLDPLRAVADAAGRSAELSSHLVADAWPLFEAGDRAAYWQAVAEAVRTIATHADAVVLAQASMAGAAERCRDLGVPVLASPEIGLAAALRIHSQTCDRAR